MANLKLITMRLEDKTKALRLGDFIMENMEGILGEWENYARRYWEGPLPDSVKLRDGAKIMLTALVSDMAVHQNEDDRKSKSEGEFEGQECGIDHAAEEHALARVEDGFDLERLVAEFRALRASVNRLWWESVPTPHHAQVDDMCRFNEALDQLVASSVAAYTERISKSRRLFLGILGHDLRQPLYSVRMFIEVLMRQGALPADAMSTLSKMGKCCESMGTLLSNLLDFTSSQLGSAMPMHPDSADLEQICEEVLNEVRAVAEDRILHLETSGKLDGEWDAVRLRQLFSNLLGNAIQHGSDEHPVKIWLKGTHDNVILVVHNMGRPIPQESMSILFDPMVRLANAKDRPTGSIGLGLYICRQIAIAHGGNIVAESSAESGTTLKVTLPRQAVA